MIIGDIETTEKVEYEDLLKNYYEKMEIIEEQDKEIERLIISLQAQEELTMKEHIKVEKLNNIINELEKWLEDYIKLFDEPDMLEEQTCEDLKEVLDKLQELKGSDKE